MRPKMGSGLPKMGSSLPVGAPGVGLPSYERAIALAIRSELGGSHQAIKTLMRWTGVSARTAKSWLAGSAGPNGANLVALIGASEPVFDAVLRLSGRSLQLTNDKDANIADLLRKAIVLLEVERAR